MSISVVIVTCLCLVQDYPAIIAQNVKRTLTHVFGGFGQVRWVIPGTQKRDSTKLYTGSLFRYEPPLASSYSPPHPAMYQRKPLQEGVHFAPIMKSFAVRVRHKVLLTVLKVQFLFCGILGLP